jgi:6-phosphofructokinase 1
MKRYDLKEDDLRIQILGKLGVASPLGLSTVYGDNIANYVTDSESVLLIDDRRYILDEIKKNEKILAFEKAGPRKDIYFDPSKTRVAIVTCGGLCPGINNVIRSLVRTLSLGYGVKTIFGIRYGYEGFIPSYKHEPVMLDTDFVDDIHIKGGSVLSSSRGHQPTGEIVDCLERMNISVLFTIGGDGTLRASNEINLEVGKRGLKIAVVGIPKTVDNDISYVEKTFGLETAFSIAAEAIRAAHAEAKGAPRGIGLVKVMGRMSGFIAANSALALNEVNFVLIPEIPFDLEGEQGLFRTLERRLERKDHAVIIVAEGAGQKYIGESADEFDASGNRRLGDIGFLLGDKIKEHFKKKRNMPINLKYIDPSYLVRAAPANAHDAIFCVQLGQNAAHAAMAGKTGLVIGSWHSCFTHVPIRLAVSKKKQVSPESPMWLSVLSETGQPISMVNGAFESS